MAKALIFLVIFSGFFSAASGQLGAQRLSTTLRQKLDSTPVGSVPADVRGRAYAKFLEGQRYFWLLNNSRRNRTRTAYEANVRASREALVASVAVDPYLGEAYTMLSELAVSAPPNDLDEAMELAGLAVRVEPNNFGSRRILARLLTFKSGMGGEKMDPATAAEAVEAWKKVTALDPRNAEAWAFLSIFYQRTSKPKERVEALQKWVAAAPALDSQFFQRVTGGVGGLDADNASMKLAEALIEDGRTAEGIAILGQLIADDPDNAEAVEAMREVAESAKGANSEAAISALRQAVMANPRNVSLAAVLADLYTDSGKPAEGTRVLRDAAEKASDPATAAMYYALLGDLQARGGADAEAVASYGKALSLRLPDGRAPVAEDEIAFATEVFKRMVRAARGTGKESDVQSVLDRAKRTLGSESDFVDRELITLYRESGKRAEALEVVRGLKARNPREEGLARLEATLLTELGRVDEGVASFRAYVAERAKPVTTGRVTVDSGPADEFSSLLFISQLYTQANRGKEAIDAAGQALMAARGAERRQIARLTMASAQQMAGDHAGAENSLREILKESPNNPIALNNLGYFLLERNERLEEALKMIQEAVNVDPTNPSYLDSLGWAYFKLGKLAEAEKHLRDAARYDSLSSTIAEHLGDVLLRQGRADDARRQWRRALELASEKGDVERIKSKLK